MGAEIVGISTDSHWSHRAYAEQIKVPFLLLSDYNRSVVRRYVGLYEDVGGYEGVNRRAVVIVGPDKLVSWVWSTDDPGESPDLEEVRIALQELVYAP